ncbi:MAG: AAA family ATPase [Paludibacteraceae bacterium]|nr:AAA family ATPase [Paludibacteraceae bacterium]
MAKKIKDTEQTQQYWTEAIAKIERLDASFMARYNLLYHLLAEFLRVKTQDSTIIFSGAQARLLYVADKCSFPYTIALNSFRYRGRHARDLDDLTLRRNWHQDVDVFAAFVCYAFGDRSRTLSIEKISDSAADSFAHWQKMRASVIGRKGSVVEVRDEVSGNEYSVSVKDWSADAIDYKAGTQLNLIDVGVDTDGLLVPSLLIYEPDMLVDISTIARCFTQHADSEKIHLLDKFSPKAQTRATLLGNLASQLLDETVNYGDSADYVKAVRKFFRSAPIDITTCEDMDVRFHDDARLQLGNLKTIIKRVQTEDRSYNKDKVMLEPSFVCETLGLQGRMDLLQSDFSLLMEQKSGKRDDFNHRHQTQHYIQMLMYLAMLHYGFGKKNDEVSAYLLYSKYPDGLMRESNAPEVVAKAIRIRNRLVCQDLMLAEPGGARKLVGALTPESMNMKQDTSKLWTDYKRPEIIRLLSPLKNATKEELDYFYRFFTFVARENVMSKVGNRIKENSGFASLWTSSLEERRRAGNIMDCMKIDRLVEDEDGTVSVIELVRDNDASDDTLSSCEYLPNFRVGDIIVLYKYNASREPDVRKAIEHRATIYSLDDNKVCVRLRAPQRNKGVFKAAKGYAWAVEHDYIDSSFGAQYRALYAFLSTNSARKKLLLGQRPPCVDNSLPEPTEYGGMNELVTKVRRAKEMFLLVGPPGTGKTSFGLMNILRDQLKNDGSSVLLMAYTNRAVDEICSKLDKDGIDFVRFGHVSSCDERFSKYLLSNRIAECSKASQMREFIVRTRVFVGTTTSVSSLQRVFTIKPFDLAIIDEASQILEPSIVGLLSAVSTAGSAPVDAIRKFVLIGDHKQLPAVVSQTAVESRIVEPSLRGLGFEDCSESLFQRLLRLYHGNEQVVYTLKFHGRMHPEIADFVNKAFYGNELLPIPLPHQSQSLGFAHVPQTGNRLVPLMSSNRWVMVDVEPTDEASFSDKANVAEAKAIADAVEAVKALREANGLAFDKESTVGVIVPYRNQIAVVRDELAKRSADYDGITIDTVERYQGSERDIIVYGFTVSRRTQIDFLTSNTFVEDGVTIDRKLNVALTRAREQNVIVCNRALVSSNPLFASLADYIERSGAVIGY